MPFEQILYIVISLSARSIFHAYVAAVVLFILPRFIFRRLGITIPRWVLVMLALVISICKEVIDYFLARPEALGSAENMAKNLIVLGICFVGFVLALIVDKKKARIKPIAIVLLTLCVSIIMSFVLTYSLPTLEPAPLYKSVLDVGSFSFGGYFLYRLLKYSPIRFDTRQEAEI